MNVAVRGVVAGLAFVCTVGGCASSGGGDRAVARDEGEFLRWAQDVNVGPGIADDRMWVLGHRDKVVAEGDQACGWLRRQPLHPAVHDRDYDAEALAARYVSAMPAIAQVASDNRATIALQAWEHLCAGEKPAHINPPPADGD